MPLLAAPAERLGIDLVWFGVILGVNMQTSFMHPPFGFALFYLRSVAPREAFIDRVTQRRMAPVTTGQIYWGAVPFVIIQVIMIGLTIAFPAMVMHYKAPVLRPSTPGATAAPAGPTAPGPNFGGASHVRQATAAPPATPNFASPPPPDFSPPAPNFGAPAK